MGRGKLGNAVLISHKLIEQAVKPGDMVIDATCGRGNDTLFLAQLVGPQGKVYAFDIQGKAIKSTRELLARHNCLEQVVLINDNHAHMASYIEGRPRACMFNLGYLPGGDHNIVTRADDIQPALAACTEFLVEGGVISLVCYPGHSGGQEEMESIENYLIKLPQQLFEVTKTLFLNQKNHPPQIISIEKISGGYL